MRTIGTTTERPVLTLIATNPDRIWVVAEPVKEALERYQLRALILLLISTISLSAAGSTGDSHYEKSRRLVELLGYRESIEQTRVACIDSLKPLHPGGALAQESNAFPGVTPDGKGWSDVLRAFAAFEQEACSGSDFQQALLERYRAAWQARLTEKQLDVALSFLQSSNGRSFSAAFRDTYRDVSEYHTPLSASMREKAFRNFERRVQEIIKATR